MADRLDLSKIYEKIDKLGENIHAIDKKVDRMQLTLDAHDAKSSKAYVKAEEALAVANEAKIPLTYLQRTATLAKWLSWVGGGAVILFQLVNWLKDT